jgi:hypothetical protein
VVFSAILGGKLAASMVLYIIFVTIFPVKITIKIKYGGFLKWWYPFNIPNQTILVLKPLKPMAVGIPQSKEISTETAQFSSRRRTFSSLISTGAQRPPECRRQPPTTPTVGRNGVGMIHGHMGDPINGESPKCL